MEVEEAAADSVTVRESNSQANPSVANVLKAWLEHHFMEDKDQDALNMVEDFATSLPVDGNGSTGLMAKQLMQLVERRVSWCVPQLTAATR